VKELEIRNTEFHTYEPKQEKHFKVVLKNMHPYINTNDFKESIEPMELTSANFALKYQAKRNRKTTLYVFYRH